jgi:lipopolysaccharide export system permease protein
MLLGNLIRFAELIVTKGVPLAVAGKLFLYLLPSLFSFTMPIATLSGVLLSVGRMSGDNELIAIRASGINLFRLLVPVIMIGLIISLCCVILNNEIIPASYHKTRTTLVEMGTQNPTAALEAGTFITAFDKYIIFIYSINGQKFSDIRIYEPQGDNKPPRTIIAKRGEFILLPEKKILKLKLIDGTSDEINPKDPENFYKINFKNYFMNIDFKKQNAKEPDKKAKDMTFGELRAKIALFNSKNVDPTPLVTEIYKRNALSFSCVIFVLIGAPFAMITRRREKSVNFGFAFLIVVVYYLMLIGSETLSIEGGLPPQLIMNIPDALLGITGIIMLKKTCSS